MALVIPYYIFNTAGSASATPELLRAAGVENPAAVMLGRQQGILWGLGIIGLYLVHLVIANTGLGYVSMPFSHLFSPLIFSLIAYYRIYTSALAHNQLSAIASGQAWQIALWIGVVVVVTLLLARLRMARYLLHFRDEKWDINTPTRFDSTFWSMMAQVYPLIYTPRTYRASENGLMIEGWYYVFPIPFSDLQSLSGVQQAVMSGTGRFFVTSGRQLIRMELLDSSDAIYISPTDRDELLRYASQHVMRQLASGRASTHRPGTTPGARDTQSGAVSSGRRPPTQSGDRSPSPSRPTGSGARNG